ncbi:MAG: TetR/AcrR family transcriptional regulator [Myxococcota bacterium]
MGRRAVHTLAALTEAGVALAADGGPPAVTMQGVAAACGATNGTLYHRFSGRPHLLGEVWLSVVEGFHRDWWAEVEPQRDPGAIAVVPLRWAATHRPAAKVLALHRVEAFLGLDSPPSVRDRAAEARRRGAEAWAALAARFGAPVDRVVFALATVPLAALRRPLTAGEPIPAAAEEWVHTTAVALLGGAR